MTLFVYKYNSHIYLHVYELPDHATSAHANVVIILKIKKNMLYKEKNMQSDNMTVDVNPFLVVKSVNINH